MRKVTKLWKNKNGRTIRICDMTDSHLQNAIRLIERNYQNLCFKVSLEADTYAASAPDGAAMAAESEARHLMEAAETLDGIEQYFPLYPDLISEARRRKIVNHELTEMIKQLCD